MEDLTLTKAAMSQLNESKAEKLTVDQATELLRILELQAVWENHVDDPTKSAGSTPDLNVRRKAFDSFQSASNGYAAKYGNFQLPEPTQCMPDRLALWCRVLHAICLRAEGVSPVQLMAKVYRLTDRIALRLGKGKVGRVTLEEMPGVVGELEVVTAWCAAMGSPPYLSHLRSIDAA